MSVFSLQLQNNILPVPASNENKLKYGEVITPLDFAEKILDLLPKKVFQNPDLKWLDPCVGTGNFCVVLYKKLFQNLFTHLTTSTGSAMTLGCFTTRVLFIVLQQLAFQFLLVITAPRIIAIFN